MFSFLSKFVNIKLLSKILVKLFSCESFSTFGDQIVENVSFRICCSLCVVGSLMMVIRLKKDQYLLTWLRIMSKTWYVLDLHLCGWNWILNMTCCPFTLKYLYCPSSTTTKKVNLVILILKGLFLFGVSDNGSSWYYFFSLLTLIWIN